MRSAFLAPLAIVFAGWLLVPDTASAAPWMFQRSNYSHTPPLAQLPKPIDPRIGGPLYTSPQGDYVRGVYRLSRTQINVRGRTVDTTWHWESWIQGGSQY